MLPALVKAWGEGTNYFLTKAGKVNLAFLNTPDWPSSTMAGGKKKKKAKRKEGGGRPTETLSGGGIEVKLQLGTPQHTSGEDSAEIAGSTTGHNLPPTHRNQTRAIEGSAIGPVNIVRSKIGSDSAEVMMGIGSTQSSHATPSIDNCGDASSSGAVGGNSPEENTYADKMWTTVRRSPHVTDTADRAAAANRPMVCAGEDCTAPNCPVCCEITSGITSSRSKLTTTSWQDSETMESGSSSKQWGVTPVNGKSGGRQHGSTDESNNTSLISHGSSDSSHEIEIRMRNTSVGTDGETSNDTSKPTYSQHAAGRRAGQSTETTDQISPAIPRAATKGGTVTTGGQQEYIATKVSGSSSMMSFGHLLSMLILHNYQPGTLTQPQKPHRMQRLLTTLPGVTTHMPKGTTTFLKRTA